MNYTDPSGLDWLDNASNFFSGFGDTVTFGLTERYRRAIGADHFTNKLSTVHQFGILLMDLDKNHTIIQQ